MGRISLYSLAFAVLSGCASAPPAPPRAETAPVGPERAEALLQVLLTLGVDYRNGGNSPASGFDCSGLVAHVFREAFRVLKPGGRLAVSDVVATASFPDEVQRDLALRAGCVAGASLIDNLEGMLADAGFVDICIQPKDESRTFIREWVPGTNIADYLISAAIEARKPERG